MADFSTITAKLTCPHEVIGPCLLINADCLAVLPLLEAGSVDAVVTDPPYHGLKDEGWDNQWETDADFLVWVSQVCGRVADVLAFNGSLYWFASPRMAGRVECEIAKTFNVLNHLVWFKGDAAGGSLKCVESLRKYWPATERIIFAERYNSDNAAKGEAGYGAKCDKLRGFVFEPLRAYLDGERERAGVTPRQVNEHTHTQMAGHWFTRVQWALPTAKHYAALRDLFNAKCNGSGPQHLRREYEDLRREYEDLRRPFAVTAADQWGDVWRFPIERNQVHPTQKPLTMMEHVVRASSRTGGLVLDPFMGSGTTGVACIRTGRRFIGIELDHGYYRTACDRIRREWEAYQGGPMFAPKQDEPALF
jgi:site-specific DNA-methyltransferase (adenine-specific)